MVANVNLLAGSGFGVESDQAIEESLSRMFTYKKTVLRRQAGLLGIPGRKFSNGRGVEGRHGGAPGKPIQSQAVQLRASGLFRCKDIIQPREALSALGVEKIGDEFIAAVKGIGKVHHDAGGQLKFSGYFQFPEVNQNASHWASRVVFQGFTEGGRSQQRPGEAKIHRAHQEQGMGLRQSEVMEKRE